MPDATTFFKPWMCSRCGYVMDAASALGENAVPAQGDVSICLNCGALYMLDDRRLWRAVTPADLAMLEPAFRREITTIQMVRSRAGIPDLATRGGRA
jgi:hypothetical protein